MPPDHIEIILKQLSDMRREQREDTAALHTKIDAMANHGCARLPEHQARLTDHESRIRENERYRQRQAGQVAVIGSFSAAITTLFVWIGKLFLTD